MVSGLRFFIRIIHEGAPTQRVISDANASLPVHFERPGLWVEMDPGNEAFLAATRSQNEGRPDGRRGGRDSPRIPRESATNRWELKVPDFRALFEDKNASFLAILSDPAPGRKWIPVK